MKEFDEQDDLWQLLGKAKNPAVSPLFARNVLREVRQSHQEQERAGGFTWFRKYWILASACSLAVVLLSMNTSRLIIHHNIPAPVVAAGIAQPVTEAAKPDDIDVISHLDELAANEENSIWLEDSSK